MPVLNTQTDRIVLASSTGLIQSLRESSKPWPIVHYMIEPMRRQAPRPLSKTSKAKAEMEAELAPTTSDPFNAPGAPAAPVNPLSDPFSDPNAPPRPVAPPAGANPFSP